VWLFGANSAEIWVDTGSASFPFERTGNAFIEYGCSSADTIQKLNDTIFWLGGGNIGSGIVYTASGYTPNRVSTNAVEFAIASYGDLSNSFATCYQQEGHTFYCLTFPTVGKTWVYDVSTTLWHERDYESPTTGISSQWRPSCIESLNGINLAGDYLDGRLYALDMDYYTNDGDNITRLRSCMAQSQNQDRLFFSTMQVDMMTGVGLPSGALAQLMLRYSNDGGQTWSNTKYANVGASGQYSARVMFNRLGSGRNRPWEISMTDPVKFVVLGAFVTASAGVQ
jgi:hypothetical protein